MAQFDETKHYLGRPCRRNGHTFDGMPDKNLRRKHNGECVECGRMRARKYMAKRRTEDPAFAARQRQSDNDYKNSSTGRAKQNASALKRYHALKHDPEWIEQRREYDRDWRKRPKNQKKRRERERKRRQEDSSWRIKERLKANLRSAFRKFSTTGKKIMPSKKYGIDYQAIIDHVGLCPGPWDEWHIDHIKPLSLFNFDDPTQVKEAFRPENHQWLPAHDNLVKWAHYDGD